MSKFLAPIHEWLFNKISILEAIEMEILKSVDSNEVLEAHKALVAKYGDFIPNKPLAEIIDVANIHGWLQERITIAESRQSAFVNILMERNESAVEGIKNIYFKTGREQGELLATKMVQPEEVFNALNNVLLEGMPCDRVNAVIGKSESELVWKTQVCVHENNWNTNGTNVSYYYSFRESFTKGFVEGVKGDFDYAYSMDGQTHTINKK